VLHLYCIRRAGEPAPEDALAGLDGAAVRLVEVGAALGAWVSALEARAVPTPERLRAHDDVVRAALRSATPLPVRFGTVLDDDADVWALLEARRADFDAALARVAGCVEMGVTVYLGDAPAAQLPVEETAAAPASGREYLERRRAALHAEQARRVEAEVLLERVASCFDAALPVVRTLLPAPGVTGTVAHLVPRDRLAEYRGAVERASRALPDVRLARSGPWAPYSFV
jgi:hypothetical protein